MDQKVAENSARIYEDYYNQKNQQELLAFSLAKISPASQFQLATMKLSGTDVGLKKRYEDAMKEYKKQYSNFSQQKNTGFNFRINTQGRGSTSASMTGRSKESRHVRGTEVHRSRLFLRTAIAGSLVDLGLLTLFNILAFVGAFVAFLRFDMR